MARDVLRRLKIPLRIAVAALLLWLVVRKIPLDNLANAFLKRSFDILCSALILREPMSPEGWIGAVLIIAAAAVSEIIPGKGK